jgi:NAD-dependent SIR2 family protein deacetylase
MPRAKADRPPFPLHKSARKPSFEEGIESVVNLIKERRNVVVLTGAGISVSCGIPDFRSKDTGLYSILDAEELGLSCPEELFDWEVFQESPQPFYTFARKLYFPLGSDERAKPSDSHKLLSLLERQKKLLRVYTQNIDGLEQEAGVSSKKIVYAHGSLQFATCLTCKRKVSAKEIEPDILVGNVARCQQPTTSPNGKVSASPVSARDPTPRSRKRARYENSLVCNGILKPGVTFFGETLHDNVGRSLEVDYDKVDALIVIGTSLSVAPISKVIGYLPPGIPRILINRTIVHTTEKDENENKEEKDFREEYVFDAYLLGFCDDVTRALAKQLFSDVNSEPHPPLDDGRLLSTLKQSDRIFNLAEWDSVRVPKDRVFLFPGAQPPAIDDEASEIEYKEVAHCDGCSKRIKGMIKKCSICFDYDLCSACFPSLSQTHHEGSHPFYEENG